jgi:hypothetical protein
MAYTVNKKLQAVNTGLGEDPPVCLQIFPAELGDAPHGVRPPQQIVLFLAELVEGQQLRPF